MSTIKQYRAFVVLLTILVVVQGDCGPSCSSCINDYCEQCGSGYFNEGGMCSSCQTGCAECNSYFVCNQCNDGYFMNFNQCENCIYGCKTCEDTIHCIQCASGHYPINDSNGKTTQCGNCIENCSQCDGPTGCITCNPLYKYEGERCVTDTELVIIIVGIVIAVCLICVGICVGICCCCCAKSSSSGRRSKYSQGPNTMVNGPNLAPPFGMHQPSQQYQAPAPLPQAYFAQQYNPQGQQFGVDQPYTAPAPFMPQPMPIASGQGQSYGYQPVQF